MSSTRRIIAMLPVAAIAAAAAPSAQAATVATQKCVPYLSGTKSMVVAGAGFNPNAFVRVQAAVGKSAPQFVTSTRTNAIGAFQSDRLFPPSFQPFRRSLQTFNLIATDATNPAAPIVATFKFKVVRFGMTALPSPRRPGQRVTYTARGWEIGKRVYVHFRHRSITRRTVSLGKAKGPCGVASRRMRAVPTKVRYGSWQAYTDQRKRFSRRTEPQWRIAFTVFRRFR